MTMVLAFGFAIIALHPQVKEMKIPTKDVGSIKICDLSEKFSNVFFQL